MNNENPMAEVATGGHVLVLDERSTGQEQLIAGMLGKQISAGGAVIVLGSSIEEPMLETLLDACHLAGREADLLVINPAKPATSHTYNPVLHSSPANIASQVLHREPRHERHRQCRAAGSDYCVSSARQHPLLVP
jgi:hypothetical protein